MELGEYCARSSPTGSRSDKWGFREALMLPSCGGEIFPQHVRFMTEGRSMAPPDEALRIPRTSRFAT
jgi:hypothetical protein